MPGGMGGMGGMMGGMPGMGGLGGMMGGMRSGMQQPQQTQQNTAAAENEIYDVDRWRRSDEQDLPAEPTNVQLVRDAWERESQKKKQKSIKTVLKKLSSRKGKKKAEKEARKQTENKSASPFEWPEEKKQGTIVMPDMKASQKRITGTKNDAADNAPLPAIEIPYEHGVNYLGLHAPAGIESFFTSSPLNSAILAGDSLSMGPLSLNQVSDGRNFAMPGPEMRPVEMPAEAPAEGKTEYMDAFRESREGRKYEVRIL